MNAILDRLRDEQPRIYGMILYVEQPFPYDLERHRMDVHSVSARKPLFLDESAHDWRLVRLGRELGWSGVALKTCKTQTGALLSACWAKAHGMSLMVQDLTNPMLAQIPHVLLAAHAGTIMGVETNAMQFYPEASRPEAAVHPGLYQRRQGRSSFPPCGGRASVIGCEKSDGSCRSRQRSVPAKKPRFPAQRSEKQGRNCRRDLIPANRETCRLLAPRLLLQEGNSAGLLCHEQALAHLASRRRPGLLRSGALPAGQGRVRGRGGAGGEPGGFRGGVGAGEVRYHPG